MKKILIILMVVVGFITAIIAQSSSTGVVTGIIKSENGKPLASVSISLYQDTNLIMSLNSDSKGRFTLPGLSKGGYQIVLKLDGYSELKHSFEYTPGQKLELKLTMKQISGDTPISPKKDKTLVNAGAVTMECLSDNVVRDRAGSSATAGSLIISEGMRGMGGNYSQALPYTPGNTDEYSSLTRNIFHSPVTEPLSTFSIDVDTAFYSQMRAMLNSGRLPAPNSVRIEELVNYFDYDYPEPEPGDDFAVYTELGANPWNQERQLLHIGINARKVKSKTAPPMNLVFLIDVSGSMNQANKLPLVKESMKLLVQEMRPQDKISMVVYAGRAGIVLEPTSGNQKSTIIAALDRLNAGGSTAGGQGIELAYSVARENYLPEGNNRVILCTDGDFNVGVSSTADLENMIENYRKQGVFLTILGFGMGNYKDDRMEALSNKGNGNYAYIDEIREARKVLVHQLPGTLFAIAKDVKFQIEFNPAHVKAYRLVGYENRMLRAEDFKDDTKDAGELGAGHTVTAIYEIIPAGSKEKIAEVDELKYQSPKTNVQSSELATVKIRYKKPDQDKSIPLDVAVGKTPRSLDKCSITYRWASAVAGFGLLVSAQENVGELSWKMVKSLAQGSMNEEDDELRTEFIGLIDKAAKLAHNNGTGGYNW